jgi:hypothetical protein
MPSNRLVNANHSPRCQHLKVNGTRCGSPARHGRAYCCFHDSATRRSQEFVLPIIEDAASLQLALNKILQALLDKLIDQKTASILLYGLQIAFANLKQLKVEQRLDQFDRALRAQQQQQEQKEELEQEEQQQEEEVEAQPDNAPNLLPSVIPSAASPERSRRASGVEGPCVSVGTTSAAHSQLETRKSQLDTSATVDLQACADPVAHAPSGVRPSIVNQQSAIAPTRNSQLTTRNWSPVIPS